MSFKSQIIKMTGWSSQEYTRKYDVFKHRVRNFNRITGQDLKPAEQFFYKLRAESKGLPSNSIQDVISRMSATTKGSGKDLLKYVSKKDVSFAGEHIKNRFSALSVKANSIETQNQMNKVINDYDNNKISVEQLNDELTKIANEYKLKQKNGLYAGSGKNE